MVGMQDEDAVHCPAQHRIDHVRLARHAERHVQEVFRVAQVVARIHERLADGVLVRHRGDRRQLGDQPVGGDHPLRRIFDIGAVVVEGREGAGHAAENRHRVGVTAEAAQEVVDLLMDHRVIGDGLVEGYHLLGRGQFAMEEQVADFKEIAVLRQIFDRIAAVQQNTFIAVDVSDLATRSYPSK